MIAQKKTTENNRQFERKSLLQYVYDRIFLLLDCVETIKLRRLSKYAIRNICTLYLHHSTHTPYQHMGKVVNILPFFSMPNVVYVCQNFVKRAAERVV